VSDKLQFVEVSRRERLAKTTTNWSLSDISRVWATTRAGKSQPRRVSERHVHLLRN